MNIIKTAAAVSAALLLTGAAWAQSAGSAKAAATDSGEIMASPKERELSSRLIDAVALMQNNQFGEALQILRGIMDADPANDAAYYYAGTCCVYMGNDEEGQALLKKAAEIDPGNYFYRERLALAYSATGDIGMTTATYEELLKEFPKKSDILYSLVSLYLKTNQLDKALECLDQIEKVSGKNENITSMRYDILLRQNKPSEAVEALLDYNKDFSSPVILAQLGDYYMAEYKDDEALDFYEEALGLQSNYAPALLGKSEIFRMRRDYPAYFKTLNKFIGDEDTGAEMKTSYMNMLLNRIDPQFIQTFRPQLDSTVDNLTLHHPKDSSALEMAGMYYYATERYDKAKEIFTANTELNPESVSARISLTQLLGYRKDWDGVLESAEKGFRDFPEESVFIDFENIAYYNKKDYQAILDNSKRILEMFPGDTSKTIPALSTMGDMYYRLGNESESFKTYEKVLKINPDYRPVLNNYAYYLSLKGKKLKKAYQMSLKTVEAEPENSTYLDTIGWILHLMGDDKEAKVYFKRAMLYGGKESKTCLLHYARVLECLGENDLSKYYKTQAENKPDDEE